MSQMNKSIPNKEKTEFFKMIGNSIIMKHSRISIIFIYNVITILTVFAFIPLLPILMNYSPDIQKIVAKISVSETVQFIVMLTPALIIGSIILSRVLKDISKWKSIIQDNNEGNLKKIGAIRKKCINLPYIVYIIQIFLVPITVAVIFSIITLLNSTSMIIVVKVLIVVFSLFSLSGIFSFVFSKRIFSKILIRTYVNEKLEGSRISINNKILLQMLPIIVVAILFTSLIGYSRLVDEKGTSQFKFYKQQLENKFLNFEKVENIDQLNTKLSEIKLDPNGIYFVVTPKGDVITSDGSKFGQIFTIELKEYSQLHDGRVYDEIGLTNAAVIRLKSESGIWSVGVKYDVVPDGVSNFFIINLIILLLLNTIILYYFSRTISGDIALIAENLSEIAEGESVDLNKKIPVTSNDEIGDLVVAFNKIQEREKEHIKEIEEQQSILMEQERLASLGHLIGGIAHNLRTPIMSLSGGIEGLKDLIKEYDESLEDEKVTKADHHEIAKEMNVWIEKMRPYCTYMSDIITAVKGQTSQPNETSNLNFTLEELQKRIEILLDHELRKRHCKLNFNLRAEKNIQINGEISVLIQVLNNLIINSVDAYEGKSGEIDFIIESSEKIVAFIIKDHGHGIPEEVQGKLFKEMITTKGAKGTGLGLYMSYSNIKARFGGKMRFESVEGSGTAFYIYIPYK